MAVKMLTKWLGVVGAVIALTMSAGALTSPASATVVTYLQNYHTGYYISDEGGLTWSHADDAYNAVIRNTVSGECLHNVANTNALSIDPCRYTDHLYLWEASSVITIGGSVSYQFKNFHTGKCLYMNDTSAIYLDTCSPNHADYWH